MNHSYVLTLEAENDLIGIWLYGESQWNEAQADHYQDNLHACFQRIAEGGVSTKPMEGMNDVHFYRCQRHFLFFTEQPNGIAIIAVLHERMDLPTRLMERLSNCLA
ncbi:MAG: type II toxin-antitoxin system RelE/ParE family toxin [Sulfitobacter sp.]